MAGVTASLRARHACNSLSCLPKRSKEDALIEGGIALIFGTADLRFAVPGQADCVSSLRYTSTFVKRQGQWRMLALQMQPRSKE
jgi:hypothetical protein